MANDAYMIGASLLKTGTLVSFRIVEEEVLTAHDEAEFGMRLLLKFVPEEGLSSAPGIARVSENVLNRENPFISAVF